MKWSKRVSSDGPLVLVVFGESGTGFDIEFAGGENGDVIDGDDEFRAPEGRDSLVEEFVTDIENFLVEGGARDGREEGDGLAFLGIGNANDGDFPVSFLVESKDLVDGGFDRFVGNHFARDF